jgi:hypothetical protein
MVENNKELYHHCFLIYITTYNYEVTSKPKGVGAEWDKLASDLN